MKRGQKFEENFRKSIDKSDPELFFYRFKDGTAGWKPTEETRFQAHNISDCMIFYRHKLFILELKSHKGKSLPFNCIRESQYREMFDVSFKKSVYPMLIVFFSDINECYAIDIRHIIALKSNSERKSIPLSYFQEKGFKIETRQLRSNFRFDVKGFLDFFIKYLTFSNTIDTMYKNI
ncbi:MAG: Holliday junction resolvase RecU [Clostridia bacterium]